MNIQNILDQLDLKKFNCHFVDVRIERTQSSFVTFQNGELVGTGEKPVMGAFVRLYQNGFWYYSSTTVVTMLETEIEKLLAQAKANISQANAYILPSDNGIHYLITKAEDAFSKISLEKKVKLTESYLPLLERIKNVQESRVAYTDIYKEKFYKSSVGTEYSYDFNQAGLVVSCTLKSGEELFEDYLPAYGAKFSELHGLEQKILDYYEESQKFLTAETITPGKYKIVMSPEITGVFTHECFGHQSEADAMMGDPEATKEWKLGSVVSSPNVSIVDCGTHDHTSGYCPIDDEGTLAQKTYLIKDGILTGRLHSTHTASVLNEKPTGNARAINFEYEPLVRMTSTYVEGGKTPLDELLKMAEGGLYFYNFKHGGAGSATFTIAPIRAYRIKNGKLAEPVRVSVMSGTVFETLRNIVACSDDFQLISSAFGGCGKMNQFPLPVVDGGPSVLVNEMQIS